MSNVQNEVNVEERRHSLTWHQTVVKEKYEALVENCEQERKWDSNGRLVPFKDREPNMPYYQYYLEICYTFLDIFSDSYCEFIK